jgi:hypothetical protein
MEVSKRSISLSQHMRRLFFFALFRQLHLLWPIFSAILVTMMGAGVVIGWTEGWRLSETFYFTFVTGLTIGYGDFVPKHTLARVLSLLIGLCGIVLTGLIAAATVQALNAAEREQSRQNDTLANSEARDR